MRVSRTESGFSWRPVLLALPVGLIFAALTISGTRSNIYDVELVEVVPTGPDTTPPGFVSAAVDGTSLMLTYNEALDPFLALGAAIILLGNWINLKKG